MQRGDLVLQDQRGEVPGDGAVPGGAAGRGAVAVGGHDREALFGEPLGL